MRIATTPAMLRQELAGPRQRLVLVPTMGALHDGHLALVQRAREAAGPAGWVAVSIFVNPIQFDRPGDLANYPQPLTEDLEKCRAAGVDLVFCPDQTAMYLPDRSITVTESLLSRQLCGATRPGHFDGVCTVVIKLFNLFQADAAVFGEKDVQQLAIIRRMVRDLDLPVDIIAHPTIREHDGLAMSSRNVRLLPEHRADAPRIHRALEATRSLLRCGERNAAPFLAAARKHLEDSPFLRIDYLEMVDAETLEPIGRIQRPAVMATAVFYGEVRLIDHATLLP
ncbi:MAG: pantoate--beta-alanine ligase [Verrucomicrobia bacterium]|nr:MAG: pantoate--beta-alanine ligase [Verrucomicrobiota bacterium]TAE85881.1 MAG: pantoate--beta-alanine ligase [Verrucomicrobiota bacterium]TAF27414.1 MAG: pantoate--beta-alanine ligase [Verrucomicrobiota bacterium]TAF42473.1 MAG: pantoate--beta-alanine ligase [Verrucomicrobiota bacterium]